MGAGGSGSPGPRGLGPPLGRSGAPLGPPRVTGRFVKRGLRGEPAVEEEAAARGGWRGGLAAVGCQVGSGSVCPHAGGCNSVKPLGCPQVVSQAQGAQAEGSGGQGSSPQTSRARVRVVLVKQRCRCSRLRASLRPRAAEPSASLKKRKGVK